MDTPAICPTCVVLVGTHRCAGCGSTRSIHPVNGAETWMLNGRIVRAFRSPRSAWVEMSQRAQIPQSEWPKAYRPVAKSTKSTKSKE